MKDLTEACKEAVEKGFAEQVSENVIVFTGEVDMDKLRAVNLSYSREFNKRFEARQIKEREAARKNWGFLVN